MDALVTPSDTHTWIERSEQLPELVEAMAQAPWIALDTESNSMFVYRERICLLQINAGGRLFVVDTLALPYAPATYDGLRGVLEDPSRPVLVHGGEYDVGCLKRDFAIAMAGIWDSQQAASFLGWERTGYGAVVEQVCQVSLGKAFTHYDWATRPLAEGALAYAVDDVRYLPRVVDHLRAEIATRDLVEELAIANQVVAGSGWSGGFDPAGFWRIKGVRELPPPAMATLAALYAWRDRLAVTRDQPPGRVVNNELLLALARTGPTNFGGLKRLGLRSWLLAEHGEQLMDTIKHARSQPPTVPARPRARDVDDAERLREERLKDWRRNEAATRAVPLQVVLPAKALEHLKQHGAAHLADVPQLGAKRIDRYGDTLRRLCG